MDLDLREFLAKFSKQRQRQDLQGGFADTECDCAARKAFGVGQLGFGGAELMMGSCDAGVQLFSLPVSQGQHRGLSG